MTGKALVPVVDEGSGRRHAVLLEQRHDLSGEDEVERFEQMVRRRGYYPFRTTPDEVRELDADEAKATELFHRLMLERVEEWIALADERLADQGIRCFVCPGNDDLFEVDEIVQNAKHV